MKKIIPLFTFTFGLHLLFASPFAPETNDEWIPYFETTNTVVVATRQGVTNAFAAPVVGRIVGL